MSQTGQSRRSDDLPGTAAQPQLPDPVAGGDCFRAAITSREQPQQNLGNTIGRRWNWRLLFSLRKRFSDFTDMLDEKLSDRAERAILQRDDSIWNAGHRQFNGQNLQVRAPRRKSQ
jgi:hypothetical protein